MVKVEEAFEEIPRVYFLPPEVKSQAGYDSALPIGYGQTNSQPTTVRMMLDWLKVDEGNKILDVGSGSGWSSALLSHLTGPTGRVIAVEKVPQLVEFGRNNCQKLGIKNVVFHQAGDKFGYEDEAPYDRILVSASASKMPKELFTQLKPGGRMVVPVKYSIYVVTKDKVGKIKQVEDHGFIFVPLVD
ncbi:MAG TPA: protein-L-isoaspartate O-methyltransferase [Candidatus Saccharimonadales bacterium]|nr:protein-L-isoaspartate O-methyltransferase [Candidatus Saccharimonadales bacterium]